MDDIPEEIPEQLHDPIRAELLRIQSKFLEPDDPGDVAERRRRLRECYDAYAKILYGAGWQLTEALLTESIPAWILRWARARGWWLTLYAVSEDSLVAGILTILAGRIAYWRAEALAPAIREPAAPLPRKMRKQAVAQYKSEVARATGKRITNADIWTAAGYTDESVFYRWLRGEMDSVAIDRVLREPICRKTSKSQSF